ncbi:hypothetical protein GCM10023084_37180 [Streptomyces lacrimifluminis]|uniref:Uncharacterized protein n=1 Tax=Streptomyces lacrimifluminis TaxID=1500077 RepID=A0A917NWZ2_9ACTN|nr:hypothetical protein GCM10012282_36770 [Streptomyces lacrimifluminis]
MPWQDLLGELASRIGGAEDDSHGSDLPPGRTGRVRTGLTVARPCRIPTGFRRTVVNIDEKVPRSGGAAKGARDGVRCAGAPYAASSAVHDNDIGAE